VTNELPDEIWITIFHLTEIANSYFYDDIENELKIFARVSKSWSRGVREVVRTRFKGEETFSNWVLLQFPDLEVLNLHFDHSIVDSTLFRLSNLKELILCNNDTITSNGLKFCTNLTKLDLSSNKQIRDESLANCTNLTMLDLSFNEQITDETLANCVNLQSVNLRNNHAISRLGLFQLANLKLDIRCSTIRVIKKLTNLTSLSIYSLETIRDEGIKDIQLTNLTYLSIESICEISFDTVKNLVNLRSLHLLQCPSIDYHGLSELSNLTSLSLDDNSMIMWDELNPRYRPTSPVLLNDQLRCLTNLTSLEIASSSVSNYGIEPLTKLSTFRFQHTTGHLNDDCLRNLPSLTHLSINREITFSGVKNLTSLTRIDMCGNTNFFATYEQLYNIKFINWSYSGDVLRRI
jgi:Leucine-rich repeat (LRR) protein